MKCLIPRIMIYSVLFFLILGITAQGESSGNPGQTANGNESMVKVTVLSWANQNPINWQMAIFLAVSGIIGALLVVFTLVGGAIPGTTGKTKIDLDTARLDILCKLQDKLIEKDPPDSEAIRTLETTINNLRDNLKAEKWRQFGVAASLYTLFGGFFACLFAQDVLQAIVIGAGWTSYIGTIGLKSDFRQMDSEKQQLINDLWNKVQDLKNNKYLRQDE
jgi:hypothetical protein